MHKGTIALLLGLGLAMSGAAQADPPRDAVEKLLAGYEPQGSPDDLRRLGPGTDRVLIAIASDPQASRLRRGRALYALGFVPSAAGRDYLRDVLRQRRAATEGADMLDATACARALGRFGAETVGDLLPLLAHPAPMVRAAAVRGLGDGGAEPARTALEQRLMAERDKDVLGAIGEALRVLPPRR